MASGKRFTLYADFGQIHVRDPKGTRSLEDAWTAAATDDRVADGGDIVGIGAKDSDDVSVSVELLPSVPQDDFAAWDHVTESSLDVASGAIVVLGCTDEVAKAKRVAAAPGTWRVRASHANLQKGRERIRLQLWPARRRDTKVLKRWSPAPVVRTKPTRIASTKQAVQAAMRGETDAALAFLLPRAQKHDFAACSTAIQLLAFRGRWRELVPLAMTVVATAPEASAGRDNCNIACDLLRRAATELKDRSIVTTAMAKLPRSAKAEGTRHLRGEVRDDVKKPTAKTRADFAEHASSPKTEARFRGKPKDRAAHLMALAHLHYGLEDEQLALWDPSNEELGFREASWIAQILARRGDAKKAWHVLSTRLARWWPSTIWDVAPVELLTDADLAPLMTRERCELVLTTVRGDEATDAAPE